MADLCGQSPWPWAGWKSGEGFYYSNLILAHWGGPGQIPKMIRRRLQGGAKMGDTFLTFFRKCINQGLQWPWIGPK